MVGLATGRGAFWKWGGLRKTKPEGGFFIGGTQPRSKPGEGWVCGELLCSLGCPNRATHLPSPSSPFGHFGADPALSQAQSEFSSPGPPAPAHHHRWPEAAPPKFALFPPELFFSCKAAASLGAFPDLEGKEIPGEGLTRFVVGFAVVNQTAPSQKNPKANPFQSWQGLLHNSSAPVRIDGSTGGSMDGWSAAWRASSMPTPSPPGIEVPAPLLAPLSTRWSPP